MTTTNIFELVKDRRSTIAFDDNHVMPDADLEKLITAAHFTPTAYNIQNYRFVVKTDKKSRHDEAFIEACWGQVKAATSSALIILCADKDAWKRPKQYWQSADEETQDKMAGMIKDYYEGKERVQLDEAHRSCGMAGMSIMLAAEGLGYNSCPMDGFDYDKVGELINLPDDHVISFMIAIGKKTKEPFPRPTLLDRDDILIREKF